MNLQSIIGHQIQHQALGSKIRIFNLQVINLLNQ